MFILNLKNTFGNFLLKTNIFPKRKQHLTMSLARLRDVVDRKEMLRSLPHKDEGTAGETSADIDHVTSENGILDLSGNIKKIFRGVPFKDLPIFNIKVSSNNTIINLTDAYGTPKMIHSCGIEGFKNAKKGTNIAAQATAISIGTNAMEMGVKIVRLRVRGLGPGRMSAVKGLQMSGLEIVSITDSTKVSWNPPRPRKQRKL